MHELGELTLVDVELVRRTPPASDDDLRHVLGTALVEAIWDQNGAACLNTPRIAGVNLTCSIPPCSAQDVHNWIANGYRFLTVVPP